MCEECSRVGNMEDNNDDMDRDKDPSDTFLKYSEPDSEDGGFPPDMYHHFLRKRCFHSFLWSYYNIVESIRRVR